MTKNLNAVASVLAILMLSVACGEQSNIAPSRISADRTAGSSDLGTGSYGLQTDSRLAPKPTQPGVSCPSVAPDLFVTAQYGHLLIEWSQLLTKAVGGWEVEVRRRNGSLNVFTAIDNPVAGGVNRGDATIFTVGDSDEALDIMPGHGFYQVRVRSILGGPDHCAGFGNWSAAVTEAIDAPPEAVEAPDPCVGLTSVGEESGPVCGEQ